MPNPGGKNIDRNTNQPQNPLEQERRGQEQQPAKPMQQPTRIDRDSEEQSTPHQTK